MKNNFFKKHKIISLIVGIVFLISLLYVIFQIIQTPNVSITKTVPQDNQQNISVKPTIYVTFNKELSDKEKEFISFETSPMFENKSEMIGDSLIIVPMKDLEQGIFYKINVLYKKNIIHSFSFETTLFTEDQIKEEGSLQTEGDRLFGDAYINFIKNYDWYQHIPIETSDYRIIYDFNKKSFRVRVLKETTKEELAEIINDATNNIKKIGVQDPINYYVLDKDNNEVTP